MLVLKLSEHLGQEETVVWRWAPDNVRRYTDPAVLRINPLEVLMAIGGLLILHRHHWRVEGYQWVALEDIARDRRIFAVALTDLPPDDQAVFPWVFHQAEEYDRVHGHEAR